MRLRRVLTAAATTIAVMAALTMIPASSASASTGVLCNENADGWFWPCMQINGYGTTIYNIAAWAHTPAWFQIPNELGDFPVTEHLELTSPNGTPLWNSPSFNIRPGQNSAAYYWIPKFHAGSPGWYCITGWDKDFEFQRWQNDGHTCGLVT